MIGLLFLAYDFVFASLFCIRISYSIGFGSCAGFTYYCVLCAGILSIFASYAHGNILCRCFSCDQTNRYYIFHSPKVPTRVLCFFYLYILNFCSLINLDLFVYKIICLSLVHCEVVWLEFGTRKCIS